MGRRFVARRLYRRVVVTSKWVSSKYAIVLMLDLAVPHSDYKNIRDICSLFGGKRVKSARLANLTTLWSTHL